jgi:hypothetical protein
MTPAPHVRLRSEALGVDGDCLHLNAEAVGVSDVYGAAQLSEMILNFTASAVRYDLLSLTNLQAELANRVETIAILRGHVERLQTELGSLPETLPQFLRRKFRNVIRRGRPKRAA